MNRAIGSVQHYLHAWHSVPHEDLFIRFRFLYLINLLFSQFRFS